MNVPPDRVPRIADQSRRHHRELSDDPGMKEAQLLLVLDHRTSDGVEKAEVGCSIENNSPDRGVEASVQPGHSVCLHDLPDAVRESFELAVRFFTDIGGKSRPCEIQRINNYEAGASCCGSRCQVTHEITPKLLPFVNSS